MTRWESSSYRQDKRAKWKVSDYNASKAAFARLLLKMSFSASAYLSVGPLVSHFQIEINPIWVPRPLSSTANCQLPLATCPNSFSHLRLILLIKYKQICLHINMYKKIAMPSHSSRTKQLIDSQRENKTEDDNRTMPKENCNPTSESVVNQ